MDHWRYYQSNLCTVIQVLFSLLPSVWLWFLKMAVSGFMNNLFTLQFFLCNCIIIMCVCEIVIMCSLFIRIRMCNATFWVEGYQISIGHPAQCSSRIGSIVMAESSYPSASSGSATETRTNRESIKVNLDKVKKFATTNFTRARQVGTDPLLNWQPRPLL